MLSLKNIGQRLLDSTTLDEKVGNFFRPKTGTLASTGRKWAQELAARPLTQNQQRVAEVPIGAMRGVTSALTGFTGLENKIAPKLGLGTFTSIKPQYAPGKVAEVAGAIGGSLIPAAPINQLARLIKPVGAVRTAQKYLGSQAGKLIAQKGLTGLGGKALANVSQGIPFTAGFALAQKIGGQQYGGKQLAGDVGFDAAAGALIPGAAATLPLLMGITKNKADLSKVLKNEAGVMALVKRMSVLDKMGTAGYQQTKAMVQKAVDVLAPDLAKNRELNKLKDGINADEWMKTVTNVLQDRLVAAKTGDYTLAGMSTRAMGKLDTPKLSVEPTTSIDKVSQSAAKYGWTAKQGEKGIELTSQNGKATILITEKKNGQYKFAWPDGEKLMDGRGQIGKSTENLIEKMFYGKQLEPSKPLSVEPTGGIKPGMSADEQLVIMQKAHDTNVKAYQDWQSGKITKSEYGKIVSANQPKPLSVEPVGGKDLLSEARKYKNAEDFVANPSTPSYHGTTWKNAMDIQREGINPQNATSLKEGQKNIFLTQDEKYATSYGKQKGGETSFVLGFRTPNDAIVEQSTFKSGMKYPDLISKKTIPPEDIFVKGKDNKWYPIKEFNFYSGEPDSFIGKNGVNSLTDIYKQAQSSPLGGKVEPKTVTPIRKPLKEVYKEQFTKAQAQEPSPGLALSQETTQVPGRETLSNPQLALPQGDYTLKQPVGETTSEYNIGRIKTINQKVAADAIKQDAPAFEKVLGEKLTHKEIIDRANEFSDDVIKTIGRKTTEELGAAQLRLRQNIANMADSGQVTPELLNAMRADASFARSTAQLLGQRAIDANPRTAYGKNMIKYVEAVNKVADDLDAVLAKAQGVDFNNKEQASAFYREFVKPTIGDWIDKVRYSSMLSSPNTVINNASSNLQGTGLLAPIEKTVTGGIDAIVSGLTGSQRKYFAGEGIEYAKGYFSNLKPALQNFADAMKGGSDASEMFDVPLTQQGTKARSAENALAFFPRLAQATDELFTTMTRSGLEKANAYKTLKGGVSQTADQMALETKRRLFNQPFGTDQSYVLNMLEYIPSKVMEATHSKNPFMKWTAKFIFPFVRIPANVFKAGVEYSPLGFSTLPGANNKIEQASKALMGTAVALGAWSLANSDRLTFGMPTSEKQRDAFTAAGLQPYSVKIGDKWIGYTKFHPIIGFNMALASAFKEALDKKTVSDDQLDTVVTVAGKWLTYFANQSYVKQMGDFMSLSAGNESAIGKAIGNYPSQMIPYRAFMGWLARAFDPNERKIDPDGSKLDKALQSIMMSIPGLRNTLPARLDSNGQPVKQQNRFLNLVAPGKVTSEVPQQKFIYDTIKAKSNQTAKDNAIKDQLRKSGTEDVAKLGEGRYAWFDKDKAEVVTIDISKPIETPKFTGNTELDKKLKSAYKGKITSRINDVVKLYEAGQIDKDTAEKQIKDLQTQSVKVTGGKNPKKITIKYTKAPKVSFKLSKPTKMSVIKAPTSKRARVSFKTYKPAKIKV